VTFFTSFPKEFEIFSSPDLQWEIFTTTLSLFETFARKADGMHLDQCCQDSLLMNH
jgi:hypothetical protein